MRMDELAAPGDRGRPRRPRPHPPRGPAPALLRVDGEHPPLVHLAPAVVGPPDPRLVPRRGDLLRHRAARGRGLGAATPTSSTPGSPPACGRSRRSAGPRTRRSCARSTRPTCSRRPATSSSSGSPGWSCSASSSRATSRSPTSTCTRSSRRPTGGGCRSRSAPASTRSSLIDGGPRPPVFEQGGEFPAYGADAVRFGLLAMSSSQDVRFNEDKVAQGRQLANKLWNASRLLLLRVPDELPEPRAVDGRGRWILSRLQRAKAATERGVRGLRVPPRRARALRLRLRRPLRLVPRADQAAALRRRQRRGLAPSRCTCCARRSRSPTR